jgi:hypothetical protein
MGDPGYSDLHLCVVHHIAASLRNLGLEVDFTDCLRHHMRKTGHLVLFLK